MAITVRKVGWLQRKFVFTGVIPLSTYLCTTSGVDKMNGTVATRIHYSMAIRTVRARSTLILHNTYLHLVETPHLIKLTLHY